MVVNRLFLAITFFTFKSISFFIIIYPLLTIPLNYIPCVLIYLCEMLCEMLFTLHLVCFAGGKVHCVSGNATENYEGSRGLRGYAVG